MQLNGNVHATDADVGANGKLTYSIHGNGSALFEIDEDTADVQVIGRLDREEQDRYDLMV